MTWFSEFLDGLREKKKAFAQDDKTGLYPVDQVFGLADLDVVPVRSQRKIDMLRVNLPTEPSR